MSPRTVKGVSGIYREKKRTNMIFKRKDAQ